MIYYYYYAYGALSCLYGCCECFYNHVSSNTAIMYTCRYGLYYHGIVICCSAGMPPIMPHRATPPDPFETQRRRIILDCKRQTQRRRNIPERKRMPEIIPDHRLFISHICCSTLLPLPLSRHPGSLRTDPSGRPFPQLD